MLGEIRCNVPFCEELTATSFCSQLLCVTHFIANCYEQLDRCEKRRILAMAGQEKAEMLRFLMECSQRTMDICLSHHDLDNLERSRLLDILLTVMDLASLVQEGPAGISGYPFKSTLKASAVSS